MYVCIMTQHIQTTQTTKEAKQILRDAHDAKFKHNDVSHDDVVAALRTLADSDDVHEFYGKALDVAETHAAVTKVLDVEIGMEPRYGRRAHVDVYHVSMEDGRIFQMGHISYGPESEEQGWTDYPDGAAREDIARLCDDISDETAEARQDPLVNQNDIDIEVP